MMNYKKAQKNLVSLGGNDVLLRKRLSNWFEQHITILQINYATAQSPQHPDPEGAKVQLRSAKVGELVQALFKQGFISVDKHEDKKLGEIEILQIAALLPVAEEVVG